MEQHVWKFGARRGGAAFALTGIAMMTFALLVPANAGATAPANTFQGLCVGTASAGTCTLDEPEGNNTATHGTTTYSRTGNLLSFVTSSDDAIQEVQICMQTSGVFASGANVCAGIHGYHVAYTHNGNVYVVDLANEGFASSDPLYWTLHVVAGGRTLQVLSPSLLPPPTTTMTLHATTTTTQSSTTSTTHASTTTSTSVPATTTTVPETTTTTEPGTTTTTEPSVTTTTAPPELQGTTTSSLPTNVLGKTLSRTGGIQWWVLVMGALMLLVGAALLLTSRLAHGASAAG